MPQKILILLYNSLINNKLVYCLEAWGSAPNTYLNKILTIQKRLLRIFFKKTSCLSLSSSLQKSTISLHPSALQTAYRSTGSQSFQEVKIYDRVLPYPTIQLSLTTCTYVVNYLWPETGIFSAISCVELVARRFTENSY